MNIVQDIPKRKQSVRDLLSSRRMMISPGVHRWASRRITHILAQQPDVARAKTIHVFWPVLSSREVDLRPFIDASIARGVTIVLPVVTGELRVPDGSPRLEHRKYSGERGLVRNRWNLKEPIDGPIVKPDDWDVIIVPAMGVDLAGNRIGHGFGYYDELLHSLFIPSVCPILSDFLVDDIPVQSSDSPVSTIITEMGYQRISAT
jgi:5-formyltetrahydrofolate cyclo-ligase